MKSYHVPVLLDESIAALNLKDHGVYLDATLGGGGHSRSILESNPTIKLFAFDQDSDSIKETKKLKETFPDRIVIFHDNFKNMINRLALERIKKIDGILFDLGVSSHQFDLKERGFSFKYNAKIDMRMDKSAKLDAGEVLNKYDYEKLRKIFYEYGEERESGRIARAVIAFREDREIETTDQLAEIIESAIYSRNQIKAKARIFQALRIYVNSELEVLRTAVQDAVRILKTEGRIAVISYHSLEDRIIKNAFKYEAKDCLCHPDILKCCCDKQSTLKIITRKPIIPQKEEIEQNNRARSAKLRIAEKKEVL